MFKRFSEDAMQHALDSDADFEAGDLLMLLEYAMSMLSDEQCKKLQQYAYQYVLPSLKDENGDPILGPDGYPDWDWGN